MTKLEIFRVIDSKCWSNTSRAEIKNLVNGCPVLNEQDLELIAYEVSNNYSSDKQVAATKSIVDGAERRSTMISLDDIQRLSEMKRTKTVEEIRQESLRDGERLGGAIVSLLDAILK